MIGLLQRVSTARVEVDLQSVGTIERGLLVLLGVEREDTQRQADRLLERLLTYRVFPDAEGKMNLNVQEVHGGVLVVPQFTLAADTRKGTRPSFTPAAPPAEGQRLYDYFVEQLRARHPRVATGCFGADMRVSLPNDGPVTFWLQVTASGES